MRSKTKPAAIQVYQGSPLEVVTVLPSLAVIQPLESWLMVIVGLADEIAGPPGLVAFARPLNKEELALSQSNAPASFVVWVGSVFPDEISGNMPAKGSLPAKLMPADMINSLWKKQAACF